MRHPVRSRPADQRPDPARRPSSRRLNLLLCGIGLWAGVSVAQPGTVALPAGPASAGGAGGAAAHDAGAAGPGAPQAVRPPPSGGERVGDATRALLGLQREGRGPARPIPGEQAGLSHQRYLDSFRQPIPDALASTVQRGTGAAGR
ncbi:MAG: DUF3613 domain-containing protein [Xylophilus ampelinus]